MVYSIRSNILFLCLFRRLPFAMRVHLFGHVICYAAFVAHGFKPSYIRKNAMISAENDWTWPKLQGKLEVRMADEDEIVPFTIDELDLIYSSGVSPVHLRMYHSILSEYARKGKSEEALSLFEEMNTNDVYPNEKTYEYLIESFIRSESLDRRSKLNEVEMTFKQLIQSGLQPSQDIAVMLIDFYGAIDLPDLAEVVFDRVSFAGTACEAPVYNALLLAWGNCSSRTNSPVKAEEVMRRMEFAGIEASLVTYERLLFSWSKSKRSDAALKSYSILQKMQAVGINPSMKCYELLLAAFARSGGSEYLDYAMEIMASLNMRSSVTEYPIPSANTNISSMKTGDDNVASAAVSVAETEAVGPSQQCYDSCVSLWAKSGRDDAPEVRVTVQLSKA